MGSLFLGRGLLASCSKVFSPAPIFSFSQLWCEQRRMGGGRPTRRRPKRTWKRDLIPIQDREALLTPLPLDDPMRFLKIEAARSDGTLTAYRDPFIQRFTNIIMKWGNKELARRLIDETMERIKRHQVKLWLAASPEERAEIECNPREVFKQAIRNASPLLQLRPINKGGVEYQVPRDVSPRMAEFRALQWFRDTCREKWWDVKIHYPENLANEIIAAYKNEIHYPKSFANEVIAAYNNEGRVIAMKRELHKTCEANRAYAHYR